MIRPDQLLQRTGSEDVDVPNEVLEDRDRTSARRDRTSENRDNSATEHDRNSDARDRAADARDRAAEARDRVAIALEAESPIPPPAERRHARAGRRRMDLIAQAARVNAAYDRAAAASDRKAAGAGRKKGALDRTEASRDRDAASADRDASARDRETSSIDELTGAYRRGTGLVELEREMTRARRNQQSFVAAFVDVDGLKFVNDSLGHDAGDQLLRRVADAMRTRLRSYDLVVRFGGDEFVCGLSNTRSAEADERFHRINLDLLTEGSSITFGLAELEPGNSLVELIAAADEALYEERRTRTVALADRAGSP